MKEEETDRKTDREIDKQTDRKTDRQTERYTGLMIALSIYYKLNLDWIDREGGRERKCVCVLKRRKWNGKQRQVF